MQVKNGVYGLLPSAVKVLKERVFQVVAGQVVGLAAPLTLL